MVNMVPIRVETRPHPSSQGHRRCVYVVAQTRPAIDDLQLTQCAGSTDPSGGRMQTGDVAFDKAILVQGREPIAMACLGPEGRAASWEVVQTLRGTVQNGEIRCPVAPLDSANQSIQRVLNSVLELAKTFDLDPDGIADHLHKNIHAEMDPNVRFTAISVLFEHFPRSDAAQTAAVEAQQDPDSRIQLAGAKHPRDHSSVQQIGNVLLSNASDTVRLDALAHLVAVGPVNQILPLLLDRLTDNSPAIQCAAARALGQMADHRCMDALIRRADDADSGLLHAIADAFALLGSADAQPTLLSMLKHSDETVQVAAMTALGAVGTEAILERLTPYTKGMMTEGPLRQTAIESVQRVQLRHQEQPATILSQPEQPSSPDVPFDSNDSENT